MRWSSEFVFRGLSKGKLNLTNEYHGYLWEVLSFDNIF